MTKTIKYSLYISFKILVFNKHTFCHLSTLFSPSPAEFKWNTSSSHSFRCFSLPVTPENLPVAKVGLAVKKSKMISQWQGLVLKLAIPNKQKDNVNLKGQAKQMLGTQKELDGNAGETTMAKNPTC